MNGLFKGKPGSIFSAVKLTVIIVVLIMINVGISAIDYSVDVTKEKYYSISQTSIEALQNLQQEINVYAVMSENSDNSNLDILKEMLKQYSAISKVNVIYKDPVLYPTFAQSYSQSDQQLAEGSVIVESAERSIVIPVYDLFVQNIDYYSGTSYYTVDIESQITNSILSAAETQINKLYTLTGHNEFPLSDRLIKQLELSNYEINELNLLLEGEIPADCNLLIITTPSRDWTNKETQQISAYLEKGGQGFFCLDNAYGEYPNLKSLLAKYGLELYNAIIVEGNERNIYPYGSLLELIPNLNPHAITEKLSARQVYTFVTMASGIRILDDIKDSLMIDGLQVTSEQAYGKTKGKASATINKEEGDIEGPLNVSVAVTDVATNTNLVVISTSSILDDSYDEAIAGGNTEFIVSSINWTQNKEDKIYIPPKLPDNEMLKIDRATAGIIRLAAVLFLPGAIIVVGLIVWFRRKSNNNLNKTK